MMRYTGTAIYDYKMIETGDKIMIGLSGGKDSLLLSLALAALLRKSPVKFSLAAATIDQSDGAMVTDAIAEYMRVLEIPLQIINHPTYKIIDVRDERSPCSLCANMRRGLLAAEAKRAGCNVLALGHHKDDAVETVLLNMFYGGRFRCYHPNLVMSRSGVRVIRPFIYIEERNIALEAERLALPVTDACCPYAGGSKRKSAKELLARLEIDIPEIKSNVVHALMNLREDEAWTRKQETSAGD